MLTTLDPHADDPMNNLLLVLIFIVAPQLLNPSGNLSNTPKATIAEFRADTPNDLFTYFMICLTEGL